MERPNNSRCDRKSTSDPTGFAALGPQNETQRLFFIAKSPDDGGTYQLWLLTIVDVGAPVPKGGTVQLTLDYDGRPTSGPFGADTAAGDSQRIVLPADTRLRRAGKRRPSASQAASSP